MTDPTSISPKPEIKCYGENNKLCNMRLYTTTKTTLEKLRRLTDEELLWTGESVYCICSHHVEQHCTDGDQYGHEITVHCHGSYERCNCEGFRTRCIRLSHSNCYKMVTEE